MFSLSSCGDDNDGDDDIDYGGSVNNSKIVGTWVIVDDIGYDTSKDKVLYHDTYTVDEESDVFIFRKDGSIRNYGYYTEDGEKILDYDINGEWRINNNILTLIDEDGDKDSAKIEKLSNTELVLYIQDDEYYYVMTYKKVK